MASRVTMKSRMPGFLLWTTLATEKNWKRYTGPRKRWSDASDIWTRKLACSRHRPRLYDVNCLKENSNTDQNIAHKLYILWKFMRPHTFIGTFVSVSALTVLANEYVSYFLKTVGNHWCGNITTTRQPNASRLLWKTLLCGWIHHPYHTGRTHVLGCSPKLAQDWAAGISLYQSGWTQILGFLTALVPALLINIYIVGLNQLFDIEVDRINKPFLPLASKELSVRWAWIIVVTCGGLGLLLGLLLPNTSMPLIGTLVASMLLGSIYSIPPIRLKRYPLLASFCILVVRGVLVNIGFSQHARIVAGYGATLSAACWFYSIFFALFGISIALMKDIPDVKGDRLFQLRSFSVILGPQLVFRWTVFFLTSVFLMSSCVLWFIVPIRFCKWILAGCHSAFGLLLLYKSFSVDAENSKQVYRFYMFMWKLFYGVYILLPLAG